MCESRPDGRNAQINVLVQSTAVALIWDRSSATNLRLASAEEMRIQGAKVVAGEHLQVEAKGDLLITSAQAVDERETRNQQRGFTASAKQTQEAEDGKPELRTGLLELRSALPVDERAAAERIVRSQCRSRSGVTPSKARAPSNTAAPIQVAWLQAPSSSGLPLSHLPSR